MTMGSPWILLVCSVCIGLCYASENFNTWDVYVDTINSLSEEQQNAKRVVKPSLIEFPDEFPCEVEVPGIFDRNGIDVHHLHPTDIKVISALGDSLSTANGAQANTIIGCLFTYKGVVYSVGGDEHPDPDNGTYTLTLATLLRDFYSQEGLYGYSTTGILTGQDNLNVAVPGAVSYNMPTQAIDLIETMKASPEVNYYHDWKVVTLFIGGNDLCGWCRNRERYSTENYINNIREALDILHAELPKTFVNLVSVLQVTEINKMNDTICNLVHLGICPCAKLEYTNATEVAEFVELMREYQEMTKELVNYGRYDTRDDFTVVVQPFLEYTGLPWNEEEGEWDDSIMAPDCFHFSELGHQLSAGGLWNNMFEPVGNKTNNWDFNNLYVECPSGGDFFKTRLNSEEFYTPVTREPTTTITTTTTTVKPTTPAKQTTAKPTTTKGTTTTKSTTTKSTPAPKEEESCQQQDYTGYLIAIFWLAIAVLVCVVILLVLTGVYFQRLESGENSFNTGSVNWEKKAQSYSNGAYGD